jgi:phospholipid/cholesterol/gamma-HCH transport system ATP-binding protein
VGPIEELLATDHPWIKEYFSGPRGRTARRGHAKRPDQSVVDKALQGRP